jgi:hypothetical protein
MRRSSLTRAYLRKSCSSRRRLLGVRRWRCTHLRLSLRIKKMKHIVSNFPCISESSTALLVCRQTVSAGDLPVGPHYHAMDVLLNQIFHESDGFV